MQGLCYIYLVTKGLVTNSGMATTVYEREIG